MLATPGRMPCRDRLCLALQVKNKSIDYSQASNMLLK
nr:MAG TPA: hypothetical protein [Caudoviricetes sp.]